MTNVCLAFLLFLGNVVLQSWALGRQELPDPPDEGVYLYQAKLITQGYLPYRDFAMTSHVPFLMYLNALVLKLCNFDMLTYHRIYVVWVFLTIFPLFSTVVYFTRSRVASLLSCIFFCTFTELVQWDAHFFAIRQASLPFFACFIYCFFVRKKAKLSHISYHSHNLGEGKKHLLISFRSKRNNACTIFRPSSCLCLAVSKRWKTALLCS